MRYRIATDQTDPAHPRLIADSEADLDFIAASYELIRFHVLAISDHQRSAEKLLNDVFDEIQAKRPKHGRSANPGSDAERGRTV